MTTGSSVEIGVDTISKLTQLVALHGVYALLVIFMFYFESRARKNVLAATKPELASFFRRQYTVAVIMIVILTAASVVIWTYSTFFYAPKVVIEGTFKGLIDQPKSPTSVGDKPLLIDTIAPFKSDDRFFTFKRPNIETDSPDVDWVLVAPPGEKTMLFAFEQQYEFIPTSDPRDIRVADSAGPSLFPKSQSTVIERFASIDLQVHPSLRRGVVHLLYKPNEKDRYTGIGKLFVYDGDIFVEIPLVDQASLGPQPAQTKVADLFGLASAWAEDLGQGKLNSTILPDASRLVDYLSSQDLRKQLQASDILVSGGVKSFPLLLKITTDSAAASSPGRSLLIHNIASIVGKIESSTQVSNLALHTALGRALYELGDYKAANVQFEKIPSESAEPSFLLLKGASALNSNNSPAALSAFSEILKRTKDPHIRSLATGNIGGVYFSQGRLPEARQNFNEALALDSTNSTAKYNLGLLELRAGKYESAEAIFKSIAKSNPNQISTRISLALALQGQGRLREAANVLEEVLPSAPNNSTILNNLAFCYALQGTNLAQALVYTERALAVDGENASYLDTKGWILHLLGRDQEARDYLRKAAAKRPQDPQIKSHLEMVVR